MANEAFSRISLHLHGVGGAGSGHPIPIGDRAYIDGGNVSSFDVGDHAARFRFDYPYSASSCVIDMFYSEGGSPASFAFRVDASRSDLYYLFARVSPYALDDRMDIVVKCGRSDFSGVSVTAADLVAAGSPEWIWVRLGWLPQDIGDQDISMLLYGQGYVVDAILVSSTDVFLLPSVIQAVDYFDSSSRFVVVDDTMDSELQRDRVVNSFSETYTTIHIKVVDINDGGNVVGEFPLVSSSCDLFGYAEDGWVNFDISAMPAFDEPEMPVRFGVAVTQSPASAKRYFVWDEDASVSATQSARTIIYEPSGSQTVENRLAIRVFSRDDTSASCIKTAPAQRQLITISDFDDVSLQPSFSNTAAADGDGGLALNLPERTVSVVVDQSGSTSWADQGDVRHSIADDLLASLDDAYPGRLNSVISTFQGERIKVEWFAATEGEISSPSNPSLAKSEATVDAGTDFAGVQVVRRFDRYPVSPTDGDIVARGMVDRHVSSPPIDSIFTYYGIFPYDSRGVFGEARYIQVPSFGGQPAGIKSLSGREVVGTGIRRSSDALLLLHIDEGSGVVLRDFSDSGNHAMVSYTTVEPVWTERTDGPPTPDGSGSKGPAIRLNGRNQRISTTGAVGTSSGEITFALWVYGFSTSSRHVVFKCALNDIDMILTWDGSNVLLSWGGFQTSMPMSSGSWHRVSVSVDGAGGLMSLFVDDEVASISVSSSPSFTAGVLNIGHDPADFAAPWFGRLTEVTVHGSLFSDEEHAEFSRGVSGDNGDRALLLKWFVNPEVVGSDGYAHVTIRRSKERGHLRVLNEDIAGAANIGNYAAPVDWTPPGTAPGFGSQPTSDLRVRLAIGDDIGPCVVQQGETIFDDNLEIGEHEFFLVEDFDSPFTTGSFGQRQRLTWECMRHFFRIFAAPGLDGADFSPADDSGLFEYTPRIVLPEDRPAADLPIVTDVSYRASASKIRIDWVVPTSPDVSSIVVYYAKNEFANIEGDPLDDTGALSSDSAYPIFVGSPADTSCVLRLGRIAIAERPGSSGNDIAQGLSFDNIVLDDIEPGKPAYFSIYTRDRFGNLSSPVQVLVDVPSTDNGVGVGPEAVIALRYERLSTGTFAVRWFNPLLPKRFFDVRPWFDEKVYLYFRVTDEYGAPLSSQNLFSIQTEYIASSSDAGSSSLPGFCFVDGNYAFDSVSRRAVVELFKFNDIVRIDQIDLASGWKRFDIGIVPTTPERLACLEAVYFAAKASVTIRQTAVNNADAILGDDASASSDRSFSFVTQPIRVAFANPLQVELRTSDVDTVLYACSRVALQSSTGPSRLCESGSSQNPSALLVGAYAGRALPMTYKVLAKYRNEPLPNGALASLSSFEDELPSFSSSLVGGQPVEACTPDQGYKFTGLAEQIDFPKKFLWQFVDLARAEINASTYTDSVLIRPSSPVASFTESSDTSYAGCLYNSTCSYRASQAVFQVTVPDTPSAAQVTATVSINGFRRTARVYTVVSPTVKIDLTIRSPNADGRDIAQQRALIYEIDPDKSFADQVVVKPVPNGTPVLWELIGFRNSRERPFYSTAVSNDPRYSFGVWDFTSNGRSDRVFFGPASDVRTSLVTVAEEPTSGDDEENNLDGGGGGSDVFVIPEEYIIRASVSFGGQRSTAQAAACLVPFNTADYQQEWDRFEGSVLRRTGIYADAPISTFGYPNTQVVYADGEDRAVFRVVRDVQSMAEGERTSNTDAFIKCYIDDGSGSGALQDSTYVPLAEGDIVNVVVERPGDLAWKLRGVYQPWWTWPVTVTIDGINFTDTSSSDDFATLPLDAVNERYFNVSTKGFIPLRWSKFGEPTVWRLGDEDLICENFAIDGWTSWPSGNPDAPSDWIDYDIAISVEADVSVDGDTRRIYGKGDRAWGNPEKLIKLREPLAVNFAYLERDGVRTSSGQIVADGQSVYSVVFVVTFANKPVPDGTPVYISSCGSSIPGVATQALYTETVQETGSWYDSNSSGGVPSSSSVVRVSLLPIQSGAGFETTVFAECNYDKSLGNPIYRQRVHGVTIRYGGAAFATLQGDGTSGGDGDGKQGSPIPPSDPPSIDNEYSADSIVQDSSLPLSSACYVRSLNVEGSAWTRTADMGFRKAWHGAAAVIEGFITFGGITPAGVTNYCEVWDGSSNRWIPRAKMPKPIMGMISISDGRYVYSIGGIEFQQVTSGGGAGFQPVCSSRIFRYDPLGDEWAELDQMPFRAEQGSSPTPGGFGGGSSAGSSFRRHAVAFGHAFIKGNYLFVVGGASKVSSSTLEPSELSSHIHVFDLTSLRWVGSFALQNADLAKVSRLHASVVDVDEDSVALVAGSGLYSENVDYSFGNSETIITIPETRKFYYASSALIDVSNFLSGNYGSSSSSSSASPFVISDGDPVVPDHPFPRDRHATVQFGGDVYLIGGTVPPVGSTLGTTATKRVDRLSLDDGGVYLRSEDVGLVTGRSLLAAAVDNSGIIIVTGGISNGHAAGFCQIALEAYGEQTEANMQRTREGYRLEDVSATVRLDGRSGVDLKVLVYDDEGAPLEGDVQVELQGYIKFQGSSSDELSSAVGGFSTSGTGGGKVFRRRRRTGTKVYPVRIDPRLVSVSDGVGYARLAPRSEDPFRPVSEIAALLNVSDLSDLGLGINADGSTADDLRGDVTLRQGKTRFPYQVIVSARIVDDFLFGSTAFDPNSEAEPQQPSSETDDGLPVEEAGFADNDVADSGDFASAARLPGFALRWLKNITMPSGVTEVASPSEGEPPRQYSYCTTAIGTVTGEGDTDLFSFISPISGIMGFTVTARGGSDLKSLVRIFDELGNPVRWESWSEQSAIGGSAQNDIFYMGFEQDGTISGWIELNSSRFFGEGQPDFRVVAGKKYYVQVSSWPTSGLPEYHNEYYDSAGNYIVQDYVHPVRHRIGEYRLIVGCPIDNIPQENLYGSTRTNYPIPCDGDIDYENLEICWDQMVPLSFFAENGMDIPADGREFIDGCEMAPHPVCVRPCMLSLTDGRSVIGAASNDPNWQLLTLPPYPCGMPPAPPVGGELCETDWPSTDCSKTIGEYLPEFCNLFVDGENFLKWAYAPWSPLWMCKADLCTKCPNLCDTKAWPDFTTLPCLSLVGCQDPIRCGSLNPEDRRVDFLCSDRYWNTYLGFDLATRSVWGQLAFGADGNRVPVELNAIYPGYDPAAVDAAYSDPSIANFSHYLLPSVSPRLRRNFRFSIPCVAGGLFQFDAVSGAQSDGQAAFAGGDGACPFTCPACVRSTENPYSGLSCSGSDNTTCSVVNVYSVPASLRSLTESSSFTNSESGSVYLPPPLAAEISDDALQFDVLSVPSALFEGQYGISNLELPDNPIVQYYADIDWVPSVRTAQFEGDSALASARAYLGDVAGSLAFGCSPIYDAISQSARSASSITDGNGTLACIVISDAEENLSRFNAVELVDDVNSLRGYRQTPVFFVNIANAYPITASASATLADQGEQRYIGVETGGSSYAVTDATSVTNVSRAIVNLARGLASGSYSAVINFGQEVTVESLSLDTNSGAIASAVLMLSSDGITYSETEAVASPSLPWTGSLRGMIFRLDIGLSQKFPAAGESFVEAVLRSVLIGYAKPSETLIVSKPRALPSAPHQVVGVADADIGTDSEVSFSAASHTYTSWNAFRSDVIPEARGGGRVIIPIRSRDASGNFRDKMSRVSPFAFSSKIGPWQRGSDVVVRVNGEVADSSMYLANPDLGTVVFRAPQSSDDVIIEISGAAESVFAFNVTNRSSASEVCINSLAVDTLETPYPKPDQNSPPDAIDLRYLDTSITLYSEVEMSYFFVDADGDQEDLGKTEIRWYRNGVEQPILRNQRSFNDLNNPDDPLYTGQFWSVNYYALAVAEGRPASILAAQNGESFINTGDQIFFEVRPHDGKAFGQNRRGPTLVVGNPPDRPDGLVIVPKLETTRDEVASLSNLSFAFANLEFFNPQKLLASSIQWLYSPAGSGGASELAITLPIPLRRDGAFGGGAYALELHRNQVVVTSSSGPTSGFPIGANVFADLILPDNSRIRSNQLTVANTPPKVSGVNFGGIGDISTGNFYIIVTVSMDDIDVSLGQPNQSLSYMASFEKSIQSGDFIPMVPAPTRLPDGSYRLISYPDGTGDFNCREQFTIRVSVTPYDGLQTGAIFTATYDHPATCSDF